MFKNFRNRDKAASMQMSYSIRAIAGVYLVYLAYQLISEGAIAENQGWKKLLMIAAIVAFAAFGAYFAIQGFKGFRNLQNGGSESAEDDTEAADNSLPEIAEDEPEEADDYPEESEDLSPSGDETISDEE